MRMTFHVIDPKTGREPIFDGNHIGREKWFRESGMYVNFADEWMITERGSLVLADITGRTVYPPPGRFKIIFEEETDDGLQKDH